MERLGTIWVRLRDGLGPRGRQLTLLAAGCLLIIAAGFYLLLAEHREPARTPLFGDQRFSPREVARMMAAFQQNGLLEAKVIGDQILVPGQAKEAYLVALDAEDALPADFDESIERAVAEVNVLTSRQQSDMTFRHALQKKLARIVAGMHGIETASVQYDEVRQPGFPPRTERQAFVAVRASGGRDLEYREIEAIRDTVAGYVGGLDRRQVTVTDLHACRAYPGQPTGDAAQNSAYVLSAAKQRIEEEYRERIATRLAVYPSLAIAVDAHFDDLPSTPSAPGADESAVATPRRPTLITASIDVPRSYFQAVWRQRASGHPESAPPESLAQIEGEVCSRIETAVAALLPPPAPGWEPEKQVIVTSHDDLALVPLVKEPAGTGREVSPLPRGWPLAGGLALAAAAGSWWGLRYLSRRRRRPARDLTVPPPAVVAESLIESRPGGRPRLLASHLQDELNGFVRRDPGLAAEVLKGWLSRAA